jgi:hypothetical protein
VYLGPAGSWTPVHSGGAMPHDPHLQHTRSALSHQPRVCCHVDVAGRPRLYRVLNWYILVAASAAGGVPFCD